MNKTIIANILLCLLLNASNINFGMDNDDSPSIPEGNLFKYSQYHEKYKILNSTTNETTMVSGASFDSVPRENKIHECSLIQYNNKLFIKTQKDNLIPIEGNIPSNKLHRLRFLRIHGQSGGNLIAKGSDDNLYFINTININWNTLPAVKKTVAFFSTLHSYKTDDKFAIHNNAVIEFNNSLDHQFNTIKYLKNTKSVTKVLRKETFPLTQENLQALQSHKAQNTSFILQIKDHESGKTTVFNVDTIVGDGDISKYNEPSQEQQKLQKPATTSKPSWWFATPARQFATGITLGALIMAVFLAINKYTDYSTKL